MKSEAERLTPAGFFALRTPLLPFDELLSWGEGLEAARLTEPGAISKALGRDRERLAERLRATFSRPELREALFVASPDLADVLDVWMADPTSQRGRRAEPAFARYFERSAGRATPFGLCAGCSVGTIGDRTRLAFEARGQYRRRSRLDMEYLLALSEALAREASLKGTLRYRPNSSLYRASGRVRYVESRVKKGNRSHYLVAVDASESLEATIARARDGATAEELAAALVGDDVSPAEAETYVTELVESQILVPELSLPVTGPEPIDALLAGLDGRPEAALIVGLLGQARHLLAAMDQRGLGVDPECYRRVARLLERLPAEVHLSRLFQVDMLKPSSATIGPDVLSEVTRGIEFLHLLAPPVGGELLRFCERFRVRYEGREVSLVDVLDEESGIGFDTTDASGEPAPLLRNLDLPVEQEATVRWGKWETFLLRKLGESLQAGTVEIVIDRLDLDKIADENRAKLPDALAAVAVIAASSQEALDRGDFRVLLGSVEGPSGARLLGRFCYADPELRQRVEGHLRAEEAFDPDTIYAEIVHLPEGRVGNILLRPVMRAHEIPFLGRSGAPEERQIPVTDLFVSVVRDTVVLRSARLGRRVVPRLTTAHNYTWRSVPLYRFLCALQRQGCSSALWWSWGPLGGAPFLPRVRLGRLVLSLARWRIRLREGKRFRGADPATRFRDVQAWRAERRLPRWVVLASGEQRLPIDIENVLSVEAFWQTVGTSEEVELEELFPGPDELCAWGPEGRFVHELVIPFVKSSPPERRVQARPSTRRPPRHPQAADRACTVSVRASASSPGVSPSKVTMRRTLLPGSEWLTARLYAGAAGVDHLLRDVVEPLVDQALGSGAADRWFFVRYGDPENHLRLRFHGSPQTLHTAVFPALQGAVAPLVEDGRLWRIQMDTYEREVERYGGFEGVELAERIFHADSEAVLGILTLLDEGDPGEEERWRLALRGADQLLSDFGFDLEAKRAIASKLREGYGREHRVDKLLRHQLADKYRSSSKDIASLLDERDPADAPLGPGLEILQHRSERLAPLLREWKGLEQLGRLSVDLATVAESFLHMHLNRMLRSAHRVQELVLYDFLDRHYTSRTARKRG